MAHDQKTIELQIKRQDGPGGRQCWERFTVPYRPNMNIISCLIDIARKPTTVEGDKTTPVQWECACLEEVCGSCTMVINGQPRQSCSALVDHFEQPITLEPLSKFPVIRDLVVDRSKMFTNLKRVKAWVPIQGTYDLGEGPLVSPEVQEQRYDYSRCMTCACCLEVCPQINDRSDFIGPAAIGQTVLFNLDPVGANLKNDRMEVMMEPGGVHACGNAQNCVKACPKEIRLTEAIIQTCRDVTGYAMKKFFGAL